MVWLPTVVLTPSEASDRR